MPKNKKAKKMGKEGKMHKAKVRGAAQKVMGGKY